MKALRMYPVLCVAALMLLLAACTATANESTTDRLTQSMQNSTTTSGGTATVGKKPAPVEPAEEERNNEEVVLKTYDRYDLMSYMTPYWSGRVVHNETVMFVGMQDKAKLLYSADEIISVRSYDLKTEYEQGVDYDYIDGYLILLEGTRIPVITEEEYYRKPTDGEDLLQTEYHGKITSIYWGEGTTMTQWQIAVTYKHSQYWKGDEVTCFKDRFDHFIGKLEKGEDVTVLFYGDSITAGANASALVGTEPYMPTYSQMFVHYIAAYYGYEIEFINAGGRLHNVSPVPDDMSYGNKGTIKYINTAVGGWSTEQGLQNAEQYVKQWIEEYGCDLFVLAFGMNNAGTEARRISDLLGQIVDVATAAAPNSDVLLIAPMSPNPDAINWYGKQVTFEPKIIQLADKINTQGTGCAVVPMTSVSQSLLTEKRFQDVTGNNINHPNDFLIRAYAQAMIQTVFGYDYFADKTPGEGITLKPVMSRLDANKLLTEAATYFQTNTELKEEQGQQFARFTSNVVPSNPTAQVIFSRFPEDISGVTLGPDKTFSIGQSKYLILKMRTNEIKQKFQIYFGTQEVLYNCKEVSLNLTEEWTTYVIDLEKAYASAYISGVDGSFNVMTLYYHIPNFAKTTVIDIAYMEFCEDWRTRVDTDTVQMIGSNGTSETQLKDSL